MPDYPERQAANDRSLNSAGNHRQLWSADEDDLLRETMEEPIQDVAYVLGRSIFAVDMRRSQVRRNAEMARASWDSLRKSASRQIVGAEVKPVSACTECFLIHAPGQTACE